MLNGVVRRSLERKRAIVRTWQISPNSYRSMIATSAGLYRVSDTVTDGAEQLPWSVILKIVRIAGLRTQAITAFGYWKREPLAYASGIFDHLPGGLTAPRCWGVFDISETSVWMLRSCDVPVLTFSRRPAFSPVRGWRRCCMSFSPRSLYRGSR
jgi:hypothetical protein